MTFFNVPVAIGDDKKSVTISQNENYYFYSKLCKTKISF